MLNNLVGRPTLGQNKLRCFPHTPDAQSPSRTDDFRADIISVRRLPKGLGVPDSAACKPQVHYPSRKISVLSQFGEISKSFKGLVLNDLVIH